MYIGYMGDVSFEVSPEHLLTPTKLSQGTSSRWQEHDLILKKPVSEFLGPGLKQVSFDIVLTTAYGIEPADEISKLMEMCEKGEVFPLIIGEKPVSENYWRLESVNVGETYYDLKDYDDSNYKEEQAKADLSGEGSA